MDQGLSCGGHLTLHKIKTVPTQETSGCQIPYMQPVNSDCTAAGTGHSETARSVRGLGSSGAPESSNRDGGRSPQSLSASFAMPVNLAQPCWEGATLPDPFVVPLRVPGSGQQEAKAPQSIVHGSLGPAPGLNCHWAASESARPS